MAQFIERRKEYRLPFEDKIVFTDGKTSYTGYALNISRGGLFVTSLEPFPIETKGTIAFFLPDQERSLCFKAKVVHIVFDRQRCEVENGMGFMFLDLTQEQRDLLDNHIRLDQQYYLDLKQILAAEQPNPQEIALRLKRLTSLHKQDLLGLRYRVNRICTLFETPAGEAPRAGQKLTA
ncbi:PilZ domain-containing protein [bacterium]|nr:PilZ domain-containing protein [bacterium]